MSTETTREVWERLEILYITPTSQIMRVKDGSVVSSTVFPEHENAVYLAIYVKKKKQAISTYIILKTLTLSSTNNHLTIIGVIIE